MSTPVRAGRGLARTSSPLANQLFDHARREQAAREKREAAAAVGGGVHRGTSNRNERGNVEDRRRRREWLVETFRADVDIAYGANHFTESVVEVEVPQGEGAPACRCYRCGVLLTVDTVTVDRVKPGAAGGTYARNNIRPACGSCNSETGGAVRR